MSQWERNLQYKINGTDKKHRLESGLEPMTINEAQSRSRRSNWLSFESVLTGYLFFVLLTLDYICLS